MKEIKMFLTAVFLLIAITALIGGLITGGWHLYLIAVLSYFVAYSLNDKPVINNENNIKSN